MKIRPKHMEFIMNYLQTKDPEVSYKLTYPKAGIKSLTAAASRLLARPEIRDYIDETVSRIQERTLRELENEEVDKLKNQLLTIDKKREVLAKMVTGQSKRKRHLRTKYGVTTVEDDIHPFAILKAIELDTRLEMFYNFLTQKGATHSNGRQFYINAPTLQQQVNILIASEQQQEEEQPVPEPVMEAAVQPAPVQAIQPVILPVPCLRRNMHLHTGQEKKQKTLLRLTKLNKLSRLTRKAGRNGPPPAQKQHLHYLATNEEHTA